MRKEYKKGTLIAFGELFLKSGGVKKLFQKRLIQNLSFFLKKENLEFKIYSFRERIFVESPEVNKAAKIIKRNFGIVWLAGCIYFPKINLKEFSDFIKNNYKDWIKKNETFAIRLRIEKGVLKESRGKVIDKIAKNIKRKVNLSKPKKEIFLEVRKKGWFLYFKKEKGAGGFPVGTSGKVLSLISGGIDSPVAAFLSAKRGAENVWLHFHSFPLVSRASIEKVKELVKIFLKYQPRLKIYFVSFQKAQVKIKALAVAKYRILLYRRLMFKIAQNIAKRENCQALVTGESLGQVSSQTLPNIKIIEEAAKIPVLRPLVSQDKEEIIRLAKKIGTFQISIKPQEDCCTLFVPKHQTAQGKIETIKELEKKIKSGKIIQGFIKEAEIEEY
jgi:thiamine biosynthesis protein ThiI